MLSSCLQNSCFEWISHLHKVYQHVLHFLLDFHFSQHAIEMNSLQLFCVSVLNSIWFFVLAAGGNGFWSSFGIGSVFCVQQKWGASRKLSLGSHAWVWRVVMTIMGDEHSIYHFSFSFNLGLYSPIWLAMWILILFYCSQRLFGPTLLCIAKLISRNVGITCFQFFSKLLLLLKFCSEIPPRVHDW